MIYFSVGEVITIVVIVTCVVLLLILYIAGSIKHWFNKRILKKKLFYYNWIPGHGNGREEWHWFETLEEAEEYNEELRADIVREEFNY